ncbi:MAG: hypothetical protein AB1427_01210 [Thermodesulfobacteriota bacterium]
MDTSAFDLDNEAAALFKKLQGLDTDYGKNLLAEGLEKFKKSEDQRQALLVELVRQLSTYLLDAHLYHNSMVEEEILNHLDETLAHLAKLTPKTRNVLIRFRGSPDDPAVSEKNDYEVIFGNTRVDAGAVLEMIKRSEDGNMRLVDQLHRAFTTFSERNFFSLYIKIPGAVPRQRLRLHDTLQALVRFQSALETNAPIEFLRQDGSKAAFPLVCNEAGTPDITLTLLAVANNLKPQVTKLLVEKVAKAKLNDRFMSVYNAIFSVPKLKEKLVPPPIEVNNVLWLMSDSEKEEVAPEKAEVARFAIHEAGGSPQQAAKVLKSVYGNDYERIDSTHLGERLHLSSGLLTSVQKATDNQRLQKEIVDNIETRLDEVRDKVIDDLFAHEEMVETATGRKIGILATLHQKLLDTVTFCKRRIETKRKMRNIVYRAINFNLQDFETLAKDFDISIEEARNLVELLKECFDDKGHFIRGAFARILPEFSRYERKIFEFLWHYLREYIHQRDRSSYLNSLQLLIAKMQHPKRAVKILLTDFHKNVKGITYSDAKALMLCSLLVRKYHKELVNMEITPEDVLQVKEGLALGVANYAAWKIDKDQPDFFEKIQTIHKQLVKGMGADAKEGLRLPLPFLFSLEREAYILFALVGGTTARSILLSALKEYGDPESTIYNSRETEKNFGLLVQNLRIVIRGLGRIGNPEDLSSLEDVKGKLDGLAARSQSERYQQAILRLAEWIESAREQMALIRE